MRLQDRNDKVFKDCTSPVDCSSDRTPKCAACNYNTRVARLSTKGVDCDKIYDTVMERVNNVQVAESNETLIDEETVALDATQIQIGGNHYKNMKITPTEYIIANKIPWREGNAIKYISRHKFKNGKEDIQKAIHCLQLILENTYAD